MLGDLGHFSPANVTDGHQFLESLGDRIDASGVALVVGARIGRVSAEVLAPFFAAVDIVERIAACAAAAAGGPVPWKGWRGPAPRVAVAAVAVGAAAVGAAHLAGWASVWAVDWAS